MPGGGGAQKLRYGVGGHRGFSLSCESSNLSLRLLRRVIHRRVRRLFRAGFHSGVRDRAESCRKCPIGSPTCTFTIAGRRSRECMGSTLPHIHKADFGTAGTPRFDRDIRRAFFERANPIFRSSPFGEQQHRNVSLANPTLRHRTWTSGMRARRPSTTGRCPARTRCQPSSGIEKRPFLAKNRSGRGIAP